MVIRAKRTRKTLGGRIAIARNAAGLTQGQLAEALDSTVSTVARYEADDFPPTLSGAVLLARTVGVDIGWLASGKGQGPT